MTDSAASKRPSGPRYHWSTRKALASAVLIAISTLPALGQERSIEPETVETRFTTPPQVATVREHPFRTETIEIEVNPFSVNFGQVEYKVSMNEGDLLLYSWTSNRSVIAEFHGHTVDDGTDPIQVMKYFADSSASANGTLIAPFDGIHGWYFANSALDDPARIQLTLSGYFELEPGIIELKR